MTDLYTHQVKSLLAAGFTDEQVDTLIDLFAPLKMSKKLTNRKYKWSEEDYDSAIHMFNQIKEKYPETPEPNLDQWADDLRKMRELDKIKPEQIATAFTWAHEHQFWSANIRSPSKLRKQWSTLCAHKKREMENGPNQFIQ